LPAQQGIAQVEGSQHNVQPTNPQPATSHQPANLQLCKTHALIKAQA
jgi:hypothetical protein